MQPDRQRCRCERGRASGAQHARTTVQNPGCDSVSVPVPVPVPVPALARPTVMIRSGPPHSPHAAGRQFKRDRDRQQHPRQSRTVGRCDACARESNSEDQTLKHRRQHR
eukprot:7390511-Prymnesium_polylepis.3